MFYICIKHNDKYGVIDSRDSVIDFFTYEELSSFLENSNLTVCGAEKKGAFWFYSIIRPNFEALVTTLRREFGYLGDVTCEEHLAGIQRKIKDIGTWQKINTDKEDITKIKLPLAKGMLVSECYAEGFLNTKSKIIWIPTKEFCDQLSAVVAELERKNCWKISYTFNADRWVDFRIVIKEIVSVKKKKG